MGRNRLAPLGLALLATWLAGAEGRRAQVVGRQLILEGKPTMLRGVCYSPVPINQSVYFSPYGDYFTSDYSFIWLRDLPLIKAMGANVLRVYGWLLENDHSDFLDAVTANGLYLMATFYMGDATEAPVQTAAQRQKVISDFRNQVAQYSTHPALLIWSFGNELNGVWNGFLQQFSRSDDMGPGSQGTRCAWDERYDDLGGCWIHKGKLPPPGSACYNSSGCVYSRLFSFINDAAVAAKEVADVLVVSAFADVDGLYDKVARAGQFAQHLDAWTAQVYRGKSFGDFFQAMGNATDKPVLLTEYGVDAYHDACGSNLEDPCYNTLGDSSASYEDGEAQAAYALALTGEIASHGSDLKGCEHARQGWEQCTAIGGFLMSWVDEFWKGAKAQASCEPTISDPDFSPKNCKVKAHVTCGNWDASYHDICGYQLDAAPDRYVNEEWFGITSPTHCSGAINSLRPRPVYWRMRELWSGEKNDTAAAAALFGDCEALFTEQCVKLGSGGGGLLLDWMHGSQTTADGSGRLTCSGHGGCTSDWKECGAGNANLSSTPCCSCDFGFAGAGCEQLDARLYIALGAGFILAMLLLLMILLSLAKLLCSRRAKVGLNEGSKPLLSS
ncbi:hypothetical protein AB1Y20_004957 [Prymnesium parvum]|uniref:Glycoside hydrolase family 2 catalytic domain-containing protein n=1 Tax=Prymnesium parvum TaxID=97485 RepID=A0AB34J2T1_PRYPA